MTIPHEYIDKDELLFEMTNTFVPQDMDTCRAYALAKKLIENTPAADVEPIKHGRWIEHHGQSYLVHPIKYDEYGNPVLQNYINYECSECGRKASELYPYCHCGAKMDGGNK